MSAVYNFSLDRSRALLLAGCFAVAAILLFFAGSISGILYSGGRATAAPASKPAPVAKPTQSRAASPPQAAPAPAPATSSPTVASGSAQIPAPATLAPSPGSVAPATAAVSSTPGQLAPAAVAAPSSTETKGPPAAPAEASAKATPQQPAAAPHPVEVSYAIPLAVRVGSFAVKENAEGLTQSLKDLGYRPVMSRWSDSRGRAWYVVKLGPYARWNAASRVAARVSIAENVRPVIGPMQ